MYILHVHTTFTFLKKTVKLIFTPLGSLNP